jgi:hypothetical protein
VTERLGRKVCVRPEGPRGDEQAKQQGDGISRETRPIAVSRDVLTDTRPLQQGVADALTVSRASMQYDCLCSLLRAVCQFSNDTNYPRSYDISTSEFSTSCTTLPTQPPSMFTNMELIQMTGMRAPKPVGLLCC